MKQFKTIEHTKADMKNLELFLTKNELIDEKKIWFAGFPHHDGAQQNAIAANLFYGNKRLKIISVYHEDVYYFHNKKSTFSIYKIGEISTKHTLRIIKKLVYPMIEIEFEGSDFISLQVNKNKQMLKPFKKLLK